MGGAAGVRIALFLHYSRLRSATALISPGAACVYALLLPFLPLPLLPIRCFPFPIPWIRAIVPQRCAGEGGSGGVGEDLGVEGVGVADGEEERDCAAEGGEEGGREGSDGYVGGEGGKGWEWWGGGRVCGRGVLGRGVGGWHGE